MTKRLQTIGNSSGIIIDKAILDILRIGPDTELDVRTDGRRLIIEPLDAERRADRLKTAYKKVATKHRETLRKLAK